MNFAVKKKADQPSGTHHEGVRVSVSRTGVIRVESDDLADNTDVKKQIAAADSIPLHTPRKKAK